MGYVQKYNDGFRYLLTCIDVFSKYTWVILLRNKTGLSLVSAFKIILSTNRKPTLLQTDDGTESKNSVFQKFLKDNGMKFFTTKSKKIMERFNRTFKTKMWKYFTANNTLRYLDVLPELVSSHNSTYHRRIKMTPNQVSLLSVGSVRRSLFGNIKSKVKFNPINLGGGGGAQRPGSSNSQLLIRNPLFYDDQTSQRVSKYSLARGTISCHRMSMTIS